MTEDLLTFPLSLREPALLGDTMMVIEQWLNPREPRDCITHVYDTNGGAWTKVTGGLWVCWMQPRGTPIREVYAMVPPDREGTRDSVMATVTLRYAP